MEIIYPLVDFKKKAVEWLQEKDRMDDICAWVEGGGSLIEMCETLEIKYSTVMRWVRNSGYPDRAKLYDAAIEARKEWMVESLVNELRAICFVDIRKAFGEDGSLLAVCDMPDDVAKALSAVDLDEEGRTKIRLWDKMAAIEKLGKNLKMFIDRVEHSGMVTLEDMVMGSMPKAITEAAPMSEAAFNTPAPENKGDGADA